MNLCRLVHETNHLLLIYNIAVFPITPKCHKSPSGTVQSMHPGPPVCGACCYNVHVLGGVPGEGRLRGGGYHLHTLRHHRQEPRQGRGGKRKVRIDIFAKISQQNKKTSFEKIQILFNFGEENFQYNANQVNHHI